MKKFRKNIVSLLLFFFYLYIPINRYFLLERTLSVSFFIGFVTEYIERQEIWNIWKRLKTAKLLQLPRYRAFNGYVLSCTMYASWSLPPIPSRQEEKTAIVVSYFSTPEFPLFRLADGSFERERVSRKTETVALGWSLSNSRKRAAKEKGRIRSVPTKTIVIPLRSTHLSTHRVSIFLFLDDNNFDGTKIMI